MASLLLLQNSIHFSRGSHQRKWKKIRLLKEIQSQQEGFQLFINPECWALRIWVISLSAMFAVTPLEYNLQPELTPCLHPSPGHWDWCGVKMVLVSISFGTAGQCLQPCSLPAVPALPLPLSIPLNAPQVLESSLWVHLPILTET